MHFLEHELSVSRSKFALNYPEKWNKTKELTSTGRHIDGILSPICAVPAYPDQYQLSDGYIGILNLLQLSSVILPVTQVDLQLDQITDEY
jgi:amidase